MALELLERAGAPAFGQGLGHGIGENVLFTLLHPTSKMPCAAVSADAFGISRPRFISVSIGPRMTAWTVTPWPARNARNDCVMLNAAAFEME